MDLSTPAGRQELGVRIQSAIMAAGFDSLPEFARQMGWSRALIYQYVSGRVLVQLDRLQQIAGATGKPVEWFLAAEPNGNSARVAELQAAMQEARQQAAGAQEALAHERGERLTDEQRRREERAALLTALCRAYRRGGEAAALLETAAQLLELSRQAGDERGLMVAQLQMGHAWYLQGDVTRAAGALREALQAALRLQDDAAAHSARQELLRALLQSGDTAGARAEAEALAGAGLWWSQWSGRVSLAAIAIQAGDLDAAAAALEAAEAIIEKADEAPARKLMARTYLTSNRATLALAGGNIREAGDLSAELHTLAARAGAMDQVREAELNQAIVALRRGHVARARELLALLGEWAEIAGDGRLRVLVLVFRSELARRCGDLKQAREAAQTALQEAATLQQAQLLAEAELALGLVEQAQGHEDAAAYHLERCRTVAGEMQYLRPELQAILALSPLAEGPAAIPPLPSVDVPADLRLEAMLLQPEADQAVLALAAEGAAADGDFWLAHAALLRICEQRLQGGDAAGAAAALNQAQALRKERMGRTACKPLTQAERALQERLRR